jgi:5-methylcytosine-specific restriction endonuclease McrA
MGKKQPNTPVSQIKNCFRMLSMRAREIQAVRRRDNNTCRQCGKKHSVAKGKEVKVQIHHSVKPNWDRIITAVREELLNPENMFAVCKECHDQIHAVDQSGWKGNYAQKKT